MIEIKNFYSRPFLNAENAILFLRENGILVEHEICSKCSNQMKILKCSRKKDGFAYVCVNQRCKKIKSLMNCLTYNTKILIHEFLRIVFSFISDLDIAQSTSICKVYSPNYIKIKQKINKYHKITKFVKVVKWAVKLLKYSLMKRRYVMERMFLILLV